MTPEINPRSPVKNPSNALKIAAKQNVEKIREILDKNALKGRFSSGPVSLFSALIGGPGEREVQNSTCYVEFDTAGQAKRFLALALAAKLDAHPSYGIKKRGMNWLKTKTFRLVRVSPTMKQLVEIDQNF